MQKHRSLPASLLAAALFSGCSTLPPENSSLTDAQNRYSSARTNPQVVSLAPLELKQAGDTLSRAEAALSKGESEESVEQLAYLTRQQVAIAEETAKRKAAEAAVNDAQAQRDQVRLAARTAEADAARRAAVQAQQTADQRAAALSAANAQAQRDEQLIAARQAEAEEARLRAQAAQQAAEQQAAALADARAQAARDQALIAQQETQLQELKELNAKQTERGMVITLGDVLFSVNKADLSPGGMRNVEKLASFLNKYPERKVLIEGHTDSTGSDSLNQALSERRAEAVRAALVGTGIAADRVTTRGYGKAYPVASNNTAAGRQLNRRVEIILSDESGNIVPR